MCAFLGGNNGRARRHRAQEEEAKIVSLAEDKEREMNGDMEDIDSEVPEEYQDSEKKKRRRHVLGEAVICRPLEVVVRDDRVEQAIRQLKNRMAREGVLRELKNRRHYFKPSELKRIKSREAARRRRKQARQKPN